MNQSRQIPCNKFDFIGWFKKQIQICLIWDVDGHILNFSVRVLRTYTKLTYNLQCLYDSSDICPSIWYFQTTIYQTTTFNKHYYSLSIIIIPNPLYAFPQTHPQIVTPPPLSTTAVPCSFWSCSSCACAVRPGWWASIVSLRSCWWWCRCPACSAPGGPSQGARSLARAGAPSARADECPDGNTETS